MSDENPTVAPAIEPELPDVEVNVDLCDRCDCADCPGVSPDTTAELAQHSKACPEKHF